ncbi:MAG: hypothetical protein GY838_13490 [bacterium]|nr:hypothetical protein [bacterium]
MAQFRGEVHGSRGTASRLGNKATGLTATANGWTVGGQVTMRHSNGEDVVDVWLTSGSTGDRPTKHLGTFLRQDIE